MYEGYVSTFKGEASSDSAGAVAWWDHKYWPLLRDLPADAAILEIGCGNGALLAYLARRGFSHARGIDISAEQVALARRRGVRADVGELFAVLGDTPARLDALIAVDVLEHFSRDELARLAPLLAGALRPGGRLLVQTANGAGLLPGQVIFGDLTHLTIFTPPTLAQLLQPVGFVDLACYETGPIPIRLRGKIDVALWRGVKAIANAVRAIETGKRQAIWTENFICRAVKG